MKKYIEGCIQEYNNMEICSKNNKNSVKCYEYFHNDKNFVIVMELCDKNLSQLLMEKTKKEKKCFNHEEILIFLEQLNNTFKIMNEKNIIHRDLKLENILIKYNNNENFDIKITDYGSSKKLKSLSRNCSTNIGTTVYMAPEILNGEKYNYKCDLWSLGIIIYKLYFGKSPFLGETEEDLKKKIEINGNKLLKKTGNEKLDDLIKRLLEKFPSQRLTWVEYLNHPFFKNNFNNKRITLIYKDYYGYQYNYIFGEKFVEKNKDNIELIINGEKSELISKYKFKLFEEIKVK